MLTLNIDNPTVENYFHQSADEIYKALEAIAMRKARLVIGDNATPQVAIEIMQDISVKAPVKKPHTTSSTKHKAPQTSTHFYTNYLPLIKPQGCNLSLNLQIGILR